MFPALSEVLSTLVWGSTPPTPRPPYPDDAYYGFRWQADKGVPDVLSFWPDDTAATGIFITFQAQQIRNLGEPFGRWDGGPGPVFDSPDQPSPALLKLIADVRRAPSPKEKTDFDGVTRLRLRDMTQFFVYTAACLDLLNRTPTGAKLLQAIAASRYPVFINPAPAGNSTAVNGTYVNTLVTAIRNFESKKKLPYDQIRGMAKACYPDDARKGFNSLARDMNALPLYSLFVKGEVEPTFLASRFRYRGKKVSGELLERWLSPDGDPDFNAFLLAGRDEWQQVNLCEYFLLAMSLALRGVAPPGNGAGCTVYFNVRNDLDNVRGSATFRPPAVGLAHELLHAMHYGAGTALGAKLGHFTTTPAELHFSGLPPFDTEPVSENAIRDEWSRISAQADPTNRWAAPVRRTVYEPPGPRDTVIGLRKQWKCP